MEEYNDQRRTSRLPIRRFKQFDGELFHEAWERFKQIVLECPHHSYTQEVLNMLFYEGLLIDCQRIVDLAVTIEDETVAEVYVAEAHKLYERLSDEIRRMCENRTQYLHDVGEYVRPRREIQQQKKDYTESIQKEEELVEPHNRMEEIKGDDENFHDKQLLISLDEKQDVASNQEEDVPLSRSFQTIFEDDSHTDVQENCVVEENNAWLDNV